MCRTILISLIGWMAVVSLAVAQPDTLWTRTFGGSSSDGGRSVQQTSDGGYILMGHTSSYGAGSDDFYLIKTDSSGNETWSQTFGGSDGDYGNSVQQTSDGGYILTGYTWSYGAGSADVYLIKTDGSGNETWSQTFGGNSWDCGSSVQQTVDGGYIIAGYTSSYGAGSEDVYLIKTDDSGNETWSQTFGGGNVDCGYSVQQTSDGGYIIAGMTDLYGTGSGDVYLIKTDSSGNETWSQTFGGNGSEGGYGVQQTPDGGYIIAGMADPYLTESYDFYLIKTDSLGNETWSQTFGGNYSDYCYGVHQASDAGYILTGATWSFGAGLSDVYLVKTDSSGNETWSQTFGGNSWDYGTSVQQTLDEGYIIAGCTGSYGAGLSDVYLIRLESEGAVHDVSIQLTYLSGSPVPAPGGIINYDVQVDNNETIPVTFDAWITVTIPTGLEITLVNRELTMPGLGSVLRNLNLNVPAGAPAGNYTMTGYTGDYPATVWNQDSFTFEKLGDGDGIFNPAAWTVTGWDGSWEMVTEIPTELSVVGNYPNPFNPTTAISYQLSALSFVNLTVCDIAGSKVAELVNGWRDAGAHEVTFDGSNLASGIYLYHLTAGDYTVSGKMVLVK